MRPSPLPDRFDKRPITLDGGLSTQCEAQGCDISGHLWSAELLRSDPDALRQAHRAYLEAGAEIVITASYQVSRAGFRHEGLTDDDADQALLDSVAIARQARDDYVTAHPGAQQPLIAASVGPYGAILADGSEYTGDYDIGENELADFHRERLAILDGSGADLLACETIPSLSEARALASVLEAVTTPAWVCFSCRDAASICDGTPVEQAVAPFTDHTSVFAVGVNCTAPEYISELIGRIHSTAPELEIVVYPNSGETYDATVSSWQGMATDEDWLVQAGEWRAAGASIIGGCCRIGPERIGELRTRLSDLPEGED